MKKMINTATIEGRVYKHELAIKTVQKQGENFGKQFINGKVSIATDEEGINIVDVFYRYVTPLTKANAENNTYKALEKIINGPTWINDGKDAATKVKLTPSIALNDFYVTEGDTERLISAKRFEGGFVNIIDKLADIADRNNFWVDMFITNTTRIEANEEKRIPEHVSVRGAVFNYKNDILPVDFVVTNPAGMTYFENLDATPAEPVFTKVWGKMISEVRAEEIKEESAFGEPAVRIVERTDKKWVLTGTATTPYDFGDEKVLTVADIQKASQNRQTYLAEVKRQNDEYKAQKAAGQTSGGFAGALGNLGTGTASAMTNYGF